MVKLPWPILALDKLNHLEVSVAVQQIELVRIQGNLGRRRDNKVSGSLIEST